MNTEQLLREAAYDKVDRFLRNNLDDADYAEYSNALEALSQPAQPAEGGEVVAWRTFDGEGGYDYRDFEGNENYAAEWERLNPRHKGWVEPLYSTPPASQEPAPAVQAVPEGWQIKRDHDGWICFKRPDGFCQALTPSEPPQTHSQTLYLLLDAMLSASPAAGSLWAIHVPGPDEYHAAPSESAAHHMAARHNAAMAEFFEKHPDPDGFGPSRESCMATACTWPGSAEAHAAALKTFDAAAWGLAAPAAKEGGE